MGHSLKVISIQSPSHDEMCRQITSYLGEQLGIATEFVADVPWQEREQLLDTHQVQIGWICGLPYVWKADKRPAAIELLAAPVMRHPRYGAKPVYFSDVIVHRDSPFRSFAALRGASWAYNEPNSQSGYHVTRYHLATLGEPRGYFGRVVEAGSHLHAIQMVLARRIDASAIDSTVLEWEFHRFPALEQRVRVIDTLGPSPIPPWVVSTTVPPALRSAIRELFLEMHEQPAGRAILEQAQIMKMERVDDRIYDPIRHMARLAQGVTL